MAEKKLKGAQTSLHKGLTRKRLHCYDSSMDLTKKSVNDEAVRTGTAPTPKTLGPRSA